MSDFVDTAGEEGAAKLNGLDLGAAVAEVQHSSTSCNYKLVCAHEEMNPRRRNTMEDVHRIVPSLPGAPEYSYFGVYDGHGGRQIVDYLEESLEANVSNELQQLDEAPIKERLTRAFLITDMHSRRLNITTSGATAVVALLRTCFADTSTAVEGEPKVVASKMLYVANVGDSRAVLAAADPSSSSGYRALRLSYDHRAEDEGEQKRIKDAGGFITRGRVLGILAVSRSFGDHGMKDFVTADPYVTETNVLTCAPDGSSDCPLLILACDGVWDVLTDQEATDLLLQHWIEKGGPFSGAAKLLVDTAIERGSADNVSAIVCWL